MKKIFLVAVLCLSLFCTLALSSCKQENYSYKQVFEVYSAIKDNYCEDGFLKVDIDFSKVVPDGAFIETDKAHIFDGVYAHYLDFASGFVFDVFSSFEDASALKNYSQTQINNLYNNFCDVKSLLESVATEIQVYEMTSGKINYKEVVRAYNLLVDRLYVLSYNFADAYYAKNPINFEDYSSLSDCGKALNHYLWYQLCLVSRVSFGFELLNYAHPNPLGDITDWLNSSQYVKNTIENSSALKDKLKTYSDVSIFISTQNQPLEMLVNLQKENEYFLDEYALFVSVKAKVDIKTFLTFSGEEEKQKYISSLDDASVSYYKVIFNFLDGKFLAVNTAFLSIADFITA